MNVMPNLDPNILMELQQMLNDFNPYVKIFHQASDMLKSNQLLDMKMIITDNRTTDPRLELRTVPFSFGTGTVQFGSVLFYFKKKCENQNNSATSDRIKTSNSSLESSHRDASNGAIESYLLIKVACRNLGV
ncbi:unnamed protein product [Rhizophagus irregularis]|nr:unnamed protein product [Rhizophagus irregularis]